LDLRQEVDNLITAGAAELAAVRLAELWRRESGPASAAFVVSRCEKLSNMLPLLRYRLAILRSFTVEPAVPLLRASAFLSGVDLTVHVGDFNAYAQEILDRESSLYHFAPNAVILALRTAPRRSRGFNGISPYPLLQARKSAFGLGILSRG
jgi:hypothetical protein